MQTIRSSSAPLCYECGQAAQPAKHPCGMNASMPGSIGDAFHSILAVLVHLDIQQTDVEEMIISHSNSHAADATEVRFLVHWSLDHWRQIKHEFPDPMTELELTAALPGGKWQITGHPDLISITGKAAFVLDYKTGRDPGNYLHQLLAYAHLIMFNDENVETVKCTQLDVRTSKTTTHTYTRKEVYDWAQYYADRLEDKQYRIGNHCGLCPRRGECPRISEWIRVMAAAFLGDEEVIMPDDKMEWGPILKKAYDRAKQLEYNLDDFKNGLKTTLKMTGPLPLENGESFGVVQKPRDVIDAGLAFDSVTTRIKVEPRDLLRGARLTKKNIKELCVSAFADEPDEKKRRTKAWQLENSLMGELSANGALDQGSADYVEVIP